MYLIIYTATIDYQPLILIPLVFPTGSKAGDTESFSVSIVDDTEVEGSEQFSLTITDSTTTAQSVSLRSMVTIAIIDNDFGKHTCTMLWYAASILTCFFPE